VRERGREGDHAVMLTHCTVLMHTNYSESLECLSQKHTVKPAAIHMHTDTVCMHVGFLAHVSRII